MTIRNNTSNYDDWGMMAKNCTVICAIGKSAEQGKSLSAQTIDSEPMLPKCVIQINENQNTRIKTIGDTMAIFSPPRTAPWLNSKGVTHQYQSLNPISVSSVGAAQTFCDREEGWTIEWITELKSLQDNTFIGANIDVMESSSSSREAIEAMESLAKHMNLKKGTDYAIIGPIRDQSYARGNMMLDPTLRLQEKNPVGFLRAKRAEELLRRRDWFNDAIPYAESQLSAPYFFSILRDHQNDWRETRTYRKDNTGNICRWCYEVSTVIANVSEIATSHPDILSIYWRTPNNPAFSPFIPFFIGISEVPPSFATGDQNQTAVFQELMNVLAYNLHRTDEVRLFWEGFDDETTRQVVGSQGVVAKVGELLAKENRDGATKLLNGFANRRCETAIKYARQLVEKINEEALIKVDYRVFDVNALI